MRTRFLTPIVATVALTGCGLPLPLPLTPASGPDAGPPEVPDPVFQQALESQPSGNRVIWRDRFGGAEGSLTLVSTFRNDSGRFCRTFEAEMESPGGWPTRWSGVACRGQEGRWVPA